MNEELKEITEEEFEKLKVNFGYEEGEEEWVIVINLKRYVKI